MGKRILVILVIAGGLAFALYLKDPGIYGEARKEFVQLVGSLKRNPPPQASPGQRTGAGGSSQPSQTPGPTRSDGALGEKPSALKTPAHGASRIYSNQLLGRDDPGFAFDNSKAPDHCFVKFEHMDTGKTAAEFFIKAGMTLETKMIGGNFRVKIALGYKWYGREKLFGPITRVEQFSENVKMDAIPVGGQNMLSGRGTRFNAELSSPASFWISRSRDSKGATPAGYIDTVPISRDEW